jgi:SAM-dependent methyltransferase
VSFKDHFSGHAARYRDARPHYPRELFAWLASQCSARGLAWDAGCGNGQASTALAAHFDEVYATDPSQPQIEHAIAHPRVRYRVEPAEQCGLADHAADLATIAQALHWLDVDAYNAQLTRVLKPGALVAQWCYGLMRVTPAFDAAVAELYEPVLGPYWPPERRHIEAGYATLPFPFAAIAVPAFEMRHEWVLAEVLGYLESWSALQRHRKATGRDALAEFQPKLASAWGDPDQRRAVVWPLTVRAGRTWRTGL